MLRNTLAHVLCMTHVSSASICTNSNAYIHVTMDGDCFAKQGHGPLASIYRAPRQHQRLMIERHAALHSGHVAVRHSAEQSDWYAGLFRQNNLYVLSE